MSKKRSELKFKLLQIRDDAGVRKEEAETFCKYAGVEIDQLEVHNVFDNPNFNESILEGFDALFIGGASEASVLEPEKYTFLEDSFELVRQCIQKEFPVFASCFGFQLAIIALGGTITRNAEDFEMGTLPISLTEKAKEDPIYQDVEDPFYAVSVHQESAHELPKNCISLAFTQVCQHSFRVDSKPFWAFQFHPELDRPTLVDRLGVFQQKYTQDAEHYQSIIQGLHETPDANKLVSNFVEYVRVFR
jgi:GMP synthase (glutamine-hydrolysing)